MAHINKYETKTGNQRWEFIVYAGMLPNGKRSQIHRRGFLSMREAKRAATRIEVELQDSGYQSQMPSQMSIEEYMHKWITELKVDAKRGTKITYINNIDEYIVPNIGHLKLKDYTTERHTKFINSLFTHEGYGKSGHGLAWNTVQSVQGTLSSAMHAAKRNGYIKINPTLDPEYNRKFVPRHKNKLRATYNAAQVQTFLKTAACQADPVWLAFFTVAFDAGLRKGENAGLHWRDINFKDETISVHGQRLLKAEQSGTRGLRSDDVIFDTTKTPAGERMLSMTDRIVAVLKDYYELFFDEDLSQIVAAKGHLHDDELVYIYSRGQSMGRPIRGNSINEAFKRIAKHAGLPMITVHDIRHSFAVRSRTADVSVDDLQDLLGHSDPTTTRIYATVTPEIKKKAANKLSKLDQNVVKNEVLDYRDDYHGDKGLNS